MKEEYVFLNFGILLPKFLRVKIYGQFLLLLRLCVLQLIGDVPFGITKQNTVLTFL